MTEAYLTLIIYFDNDDIYVNHRFGRFEINIDGKTEKVHKDNVKEFIRIFATTEKV